VNIHIQFFSAAGLWFSGGTVEIILLPLKCYHKYFCDLFSDAAMMLLNVGKVKCDTYPGLCLEEDLRSSTTGKFLGDVPVNCGNGQVKSSLSAIL